VRRETKLIKSSLTDSSHFILRIGKLSPVMGTETDFKLANLSYMGKTGEILQL
jgi:hypothetical protein